MAGLYTNPTFDNPGFRAQEAQEDLNPQTDVATRAGAIFETGIAPSLARRPGAEYEEPLLSGELHGPMPQRPDSPIIDAKTAQEKYGIGDLKFELPLRDDDAKQLRNNKIDELRRQDVMSRTPPGIGAGVTNFFLNATLDPIGDAAMVIPGFGEARFARAFGAADMAGLGILGRTAARVGAGAASAGSVQAGLDVARLGIAHETHEDFTPADAILDVAGGMAFGGIFHGAMGAAGDALTGRFRNSLEGHLADTNVETGDAAMKTSLAQMLSGRPVEVRPFFQNDLQERLMSGTSISGFQPDMAGHFTGNKEGSQIPPLEVPAVNKKGEAFSYSDEAAAQKEADRRGAKEGTTLTVRQQPDGSYILTREFKGDVVRDEAGQPQVYDTMNIANKTRTRMNEANPEQVLQVVPAPEGKGYILVHGGEDADIAGMKAKPDVLGVSDKRRQQAVMDRRQIATKAEIQRVIDQSVKPGPQERALQYAAGKIEPRVQATMDRATAADMAVPKTFEEHAQLAKDMGDSIERDLKQAQKEERLPENIPELDELTEHMKETMSKTPWYETLAACMTQELE